MANGHLELYYNDAQITSLTIGYSTFYSGADQRKYQSSASLAFVLEIHRWPMNSTHKGPVTRKMFPFDDVIMNNVNGKLWSKGYLALAWPRVGFGGEVDTGRHCREKARVVVRSLATSLRLFCRKTEQVTNMNITPIGSESLWKSLKKAVLNAIFVIWFDAPLGTRESRENSLLECK